jgi:4-hydroxymandelate oxidase
MAAPPIVAPTAFHKLFHPDGEMATVLGAGATGTGMAVSTQASVSLEEVAAARHAPLWFQLYMQHRREDTLSLARRAEAAGYEALVVTVDAPVNGARNEESRAGFRLPAGVEAVNVGGMPVPSSTAGPGESPVFRGILDRAPTWRDIEWLRAETRLPLLLKGILHPADALLAVEAGMDGIVVSNHGGRTLDTLPATIAALPAVADAVAGRIPVLLDGGIRRGSDVLKALALGAKAVMVGRPVVHGLTVAGAVGVAHVLGILRAELEAAMALAGRATVASIDRSVIWTG